MSVAEGQNVYYDPPTAAAQAEINTWASMYDTLLKTGTPAAGAASFAFTNPAMNTPLFSVLVAAKRTAADVTGINPCNPDSTPIDPGGGADALSANATSWMTSNTVSTDIVNDPDASATLIQAAAADPDAALAIDGSTLQALNLTATTVSGDPVTVSYAAVSDDTLAWISDFTAASTAYAATLDPTDNARRLLLGTPRTVDQVEANTKSWAAANGHEFTTYQIEATFGRYGTLPLVVVSVSPDAAGTDGFYLLVDGVNGMVDGPFTLGALPAAATLLSGHSDAYQSGTAYKAVTAGTGCAALPVAGWKGSPPPGYFPRPIAPGPVPAWPPGSPVPVCGAIPPPPPPCYPFPPDKTRPGWMGDYNCLTGGTPTSPTCTCTSFGEWLGPLPTDPIIISRQQCVLSGACPTTAPAAPPGTPYPPPYGGCTQQWWN